LQARDRKQCTPRRVRDPAAVLQEIFDRALDRVFDAFETAHTEKLRIGQRTRGQLAFLHFDEGYARFADFHYDGMMRIVVAINAEQLVVVPDVRLVERQMHLVRRRTAAPAPAYDFCWHGVVGQFYTQSNCKKTCVNSEKRSASGSVPSTSKFSPTVFLTAPLSVPAHASV
jgi:hypothetical protein